MQSAVKEQFFSKMFIRQTERKYATVIMSLLLGTMLSMTSHAQDFLPAEQAFSLNSQSITENQAQLQWKIADEYYLYHNKFKVLENGKPIKLNVPKGQPKQDPTFGLTDVHYQGVTASFTTKPNQQYQVIWQGCANEGLCYPPQRKTISTDEYGLITLEKKSLSSFRATTASPFAANKKVEGLQDDAVNTQPTTKINGASTQEQKSLAVNKDSEQPREKNVDAKSEHNSSNSNVTRIQSTQDSAKNNPIDPQSQGKQEKNKTIPPEDKALSKSDLSAAGATALATSQAAEPKTADNTTTANPMDNHAMMSSEVMSDNHQDNIAEQTMASATTVAASSTVENPVENQNHIKPLTNQNPQKISLNNDQAFLNLLNQHNMLFNLVLFLGFGILLAFLPCSLPLIPILSSVLIQQHKGYRAFFIALAFIVSMASVYAIMGVIVSSLGYSFQRFFQQAWVLVLFASLFIIFAINLFGYFELSLPQKWLNKLNQLHQRQQGGQIGSAMVMGALSALIVGPCMSAPLAGALLYVSQLQNNILGAMYLFALGLGIGIPVLLVSVFGTRFIPKAGEWMNHLKVLFGFLMLAMAVYFIRPLLNISWYQTLLALIAFATLIYTAYLIWKAQKHTAKIILTLLSVGLFMFGLNQIQQAWQSGQNQQYVAKEQRVTWHKVTTQAMFEQILEQAKNQAQQQKTAILIDVYADWCVSCQPIEQQVFPRQDVQEALQKVQRIKLDLTDYEESQDVILQQWQILGPPTLLFLNPQGEEYRDLRLTGAFSAEQFLERMQQITPNE